MSTWDAWYDEEGDDLNRESDDSILEDADLKYDLARERRMFGED